MNGGIHRIDGLQEWERVNGFFDSLSGINVGLKVGLIEPKKATKLDPLLCVN